MAIRDRRSSIAGETTFVVWPNIPSAIYRCGGIEEGPAFSHIVFGQRVLQEGSIDRL
jgi:hypothetical protein